MYDIVNEKGHGKQMKRWCDESSVYGSALCVSRREQTIVLPMWHIENTVFVAHTDVDQWRFNVGPGSQTFWMSLSSVDSFFRSLLFKPFPHVQSKVSFQDSVNAKFNSPSDDVTCQQLSCFWINESFPNPPLLCHICFMCPHPHCIQSVTQLFIYKLYWLAVTIVV